MIQRLARLLVQDLERGPVVGKRGKTDGNRNRTRHILMREGRRTYPGSRLSADSFPTMPGTTKTNSPPPMREAISASPSCSCRTAPIRLRTTSPALWPNVSLMPLKSSMSTMPRKKALFSSQNRLQPSDEGIARKQAGKPVMFRPALQVPVRQTQPPCQRIPLGPVKKVFILNMMANNRRKSRGR